MIGKIIVWVFCVMFIYVLFASQNYYCFLLYYSLSYCLRTAYFALANGTVWYFCQRFILVSFPTSGNVHCTTDV